MGNDVGQAVPSSPLFAEAWASPRGIWSGGIPVKAAADGTDTTPAVTEEFVTEITLEGPKLVTGFATFNGSLVAGNIQLQLYSSAGKKIAASASTVQANADTLQRVPFVGGPLRLPAGTYYVGQQCNNTGARLNTHPIGNHGTVKKTAQVYGTFVDFTPPTTFTASVGPMGAFY